MWYILVWWLIGFILMFIGDYADMKCQFEKYHCPTRLFILKAGVFALLGPILLMPVFFASYDAFQTNARYSNWWNKPICGNKIDSLPVGTYKGHKGVKN